MEQRSTEHGFGRRVYVVDGARTPCLKARGAPGPFTAAELATQAARSLLLRQSFAPTAFDEVIAGCVMPGPDEANIARIVALRVGCGERVPAFTVQRNCASGMQALDTAARNIGSGRADLILAGGIEAMSHAPVLLGTTMVAWLAHWSRAKGVVARAKMLAQLRPAHFTPIIGLLRGLTDPVVGLSMGQTAEILAHRFNISREQMDAFAMSSHQRLAAAQDQNHLDEVEVVYDHVGKCYTEDDGVRLETEMTSLGKLKPVFDKPFGKVTAGNSAQVTDGAAWLILASEEAVQRHNLPVLARLVDSEWAGVDPAQMGLGPVHAMAPLLMRHGYDTGDIDYWEINEAFAAQILACMAAWSDADYCRTQLNRENPFSPIDHARLNVDGGGVSIGHPVGASGARIVLHLIHILRRQNAKRGIASLCIGGGQGGALLVENVGGGV
jgi:acetyl-CoA C-acetyltransferase